MAAERHGAPQKSIKPLFSALASQLFIVILKMLIFNAMLKVYFVYLIDLLGRVAME
jgi:hypothetical protein